MTADRRDLGWEYVGRVGVDSGRVLLCDPVYSDMIGPVEELPLDGPVNVIGPAGPIELAAIVASGYGDGIYPVEIRRGVDGFVAELRVIFIDEDE